MLLFIFTIVFLAVVFCIFFFIRTHGTMRNFRNNQESISKHSHDNQYALEKKFMSITDKNSEKIKDLKDHHSSRLNDASSQFDEMKDRHITFEESTKNDFSKVNENINLLDKKIDSQILPIEEDVKELQNNIISVKNTLDDNIKNLQNDLDNVNNSGSNNTLSDDYVKDLINKVIDEKDLGDIGKTDFLKEEDLKSLSFDEIKASENVQVGKFKLFEQDDALFIKNVKNPDNNFLLFS